MAAGAAKANPTINQAASGPVTRCICPTSGFSGFSIRSGRFRPHPTSARAEGKPVIGTKI